MLEQMKKKTNKEHQNLQDNEKTALFNMLEIFKDKYKIDARYIKEKQTNNTFIWVACDDFDIVFTICTARGSDKCIKIEELVINPNMRGKGIGTNILEIIKTACDNDNAKVGFWVKKDNIKLQNYYKKLGFKQMETLDDIWFEYN